MLSCAHWIQNANEAAFEVILMNSAQSNIRTTSLKVLGARQILGDRRLKAKGRKPEKQDNISDGLPLWGLPTSVAEAWVVGTWPW
jgi:hypothetical protein